MEKLEEGAKKLGITLSFKQLEQFSRYSRELVAWNQRINLTSITDYEEVQVKHFLDSLTVVLAWPQSVKAADMSCLDVGTGAGFPGLPLKIAFPEIKMVLLEATAKKTVFLNHIISALKLEKVEVVTGRAEEVAHLEKYREQFHIVLSRATAPLSVLTELTLPFAVIGGRVVAQKKGDITMEMNQALGAIATLGGKLREIKTVLPEEFPDEHKLVIIEKIAPTPAQYPRRPGIPSKRPLV